MQRYHQLLLLLFLPATVLLAQLPPPPPPANCSGDIFQIVEQMPVLRECFEDFDTRQEHKECTEEIVLGLIQHHLRWPKLTACFEGFAVVSFWVQKNGTLTDFTVVREPNQAAGKEALRAVKLMAKATAPWVPGKNGPQLQPVVVRMNLPVRFAL